MKSHRALIALTKEGIFRLPVEEEEEEGVSGGVSGGSGGEVASLGFRELNGNDQRSLKTLHRGSKDR